MRFPIEFAKNRGDYDVLSPIINVAGNAAVVGVTGLTLGAISYVALKALGFTGLTAGLAAAIPLSVGAVSAAGAVFLGICLVVIAIETVKALHTRL